MKQLILFAETLGYHYWQGYWYNINFEGRLFTKQEIEQLWQKRNKDLK